MSLKNNNPINYIEDNGDISNGTFVSYIDPIATEDGFEPIIHCKIKINNQEKTVEVGRVKHADFSGTMDFQIALAEIAQNNE